VIDSRSQWTTEPKYAGQYNPASYPSPGQRAEERIIREPDQDLYLKPKGTDRHPVHACLGSAKAI